MFAVPAAQRLACFLANLRTPKHKRTKFALGAKKARLVVLYSGFSSWE
jgi:hypothetical protein